MASSLELGRLKEELREKYKVIGPASQREVAKLEERAWELQKALCIADKTRLPNRRMFFGELGAAQQQSDIRSRLLTLDHWAEPVWEKIEKNGLSLYTARDLLTKTRETGRKLTLSARDAFDVVWKEYSEGTVEIQLGSGSVFHRKVGISADPLDDPRADDWDFDVDDSKKFYAKLHSLTAAFVANRLSGEEPSIQKELISNFEFEVRACYEDLLRRITYQRKNLKLGTEFSISTSELRQACECLGINAPKREQPVDMIEARSSYRKLAARYHPDRNGGDHKMVKQYQAVNEAMKIIRDYMNQLEDQEK